jgi:Sulfatase
MDTTMVAGRHYDRSLGSPALKNPPSYGYPEAPANWETASQIGAKPKCQTFNKTFSAVVWGDVADDHTRVGFSIAQYPNPNGYSRLAGLGIASAPYAYWQRSLDTYTKCMTLVDEQIGTVLNALPADVAKNTIIVFTSDHGEYAGAHGFPAGKTGSVYDEAFHLPLIVCDPSGRFTGDTGSIRTGLTSSVDMLGMLVSFAYDGTRNWITPELSRPYASRHDMIPMLKSKIAPGRDYVLLVSDEIVPNFYNWLNAGLHLIGVRTQFGKLGVYAHWTPTGDIDRTQLIETEYYNYATADGQLELTSTPYSPAAQTLLNTLPAIINNELRAPIALNLQLPQAASKARYLVYSAILANLPGNQISALAFGADF